MIPASLLKAFSSVGGPGGKQMGPTLLCGQVQQDTWGESPLPPKVYPCHSTVGRISKATWFTLKNQAVWSFGSWVYQTTDLTEEDFGHPEGFRGV